MRIAALPVGAPLIVEGRPARFYGMTGYLITLKVKRRIVYLRGDPRIKDIAI